MDQAVTQLLSWGSIYLAVAVVIITFFARRIVETAVPSVDDKAPPTPFGRWWQGVILYAIPVASGSVLALLASKSGWELALCTTTGGCILYGAIVGWFSSFLYKVFRKALKARTGIDPVPGPASVLSSDSEPKE